MENSFYENEEINNNIINDNYYTRKNKPSKEYNSEEINYSNFEKLHSTHYNNAFLKTHLKKYKLKSTGNKNELITRLYNYLKSSKYIIKIQKLYRGSLIRKLIYLRGPALKNRDICVNTEDFLTMDYIKNIPTLDFFSYKDDDGKIYGFNIISIYNLIQKSNREPTNPYTRNPIHVNIINNVKTIIKICKAIKTPINIIIKNIRFIPIYQ